MAQSLLQFFPSPDNPNAKSNGFDNYIVNAVDSDGYDNEFGRVDFNLSDKNRLNIDARHNYRREDKNDYFNNISTGNYLYLSYRLPTRSIRWAAELRTGYWRISFRPASLTSIA